VDRKSRPEENASSELVREGDRISAKLGKFLPSLTLRLEPDQLDAGLEAAAGALGEFR